jgi:iron complex outermembrane receptor protein
MSDTVFAIFSDRGRFPNLKETYSYKFLTAAPNPELGPERSRNWDLGYSHGFGGKTVAQVELFRSNLRDAIQSIYVVDAAGICTGNNGAAFAGYCSQSYNIGKEVHEGAEISVRSNPISRVSFDASYSFINRTLEYDWSNLPLKSSVLTTVATLTSMPKNKVVSNLTVELPRRILGMATFRYEGGIRIQDTNIIPLPNANGTSFGVVDLGVIVPIKAGIKAQAGVKNLFDRDYYYSTGYPEMGRSGYVNVRFQY